MIYTCIHVCIYIYIYIYAYIHTYIHTSVQGPKQPTTCGHRNDQAQGPPVNLLPVPLILYTQSPLQDSRLLGPRPWRILAATYEQMGS